MGRTGPLLEPRRRPQAGTSGDPRSQNADSSPRAQGALGLGLAAKPKGKCRAPRALTTCGLGRPIEFDGTWACPLPRRLLGPAALHTCPLALLLSQVRACLGPGGYCRRSGNGGPQTCLPAACSTAHQWPNMARLHQPKLKTLARGQASWGGRCKASSGAASPGRLARRWRDQGKEYLARCS